MAAEEAAPAPRPPARVRGQKARSLHVSVGVKDGQSVDRDIEFFDRSRRRIGIEPNFLKDLPVVIERDRTGGTRGRELTTTPENQRPNGLGITGFRNPVVLQLIERHDGAALREERQIPIPESQHVGRIAGRDRHLCLLVNPTHGEIVHENSPLGFVEPIHHDLHGRRLVAGPLLPVVQNNPAPALQATTFWPERGVSPGAGGEEPQRGASRDGFRIDGHGLVSALEKTPRW